MDSVPLAKNPSRQRIVQVCVCRSGSRDGRMECLMPAKRVLAVALTLLLAVSFAAPSGARALAIMQAATSNRSIIDGIHE